MAKNYKAESVYNCYASLARYLKEESVIKACKIWDQYSFPLAIKTLDDFEGNNYRLIFDILKYKSMRLSDACSLIFFRSKAGMWYTYKKKRMGQNKLGQMLHQIVTLTDIELSDGQKIVNHRCHRTEIQMLKDGDIPEYEIIEFSGHRSWKGNSWENLNDKYDSDLEFSGKNIDYKLNKEQGNSHDREDLGEIEHNSSSSKSTLYKCTPLGPGVELVEFDLKLFLNSKDKLRVIEIWANKIIDNNKTPENNFYLALLNKRQSSYQVLQKTKKG
ncbi:hypothetical protein C1646_669722 [Rhizophagus diaphanus]|nr:hypothetical protein C1646_669722 [Rhizophagus diaphanus] [Rhizophagus sp. MUCL 43196]